MTKPAELIAKFWKALKSDMTMMLGISGVDEGHTRPMTAQLEGDEGGPIWFFTAKDNDLVQQLRGNDRAVATFASKNHDVFAAVHGNLRVDTDRVVVDRLWTVSSPLGTRGQGRPEARAAAARSRRWTDLGRRFELRCGHQGVPRDRSEGGLQG